MRSRRLLHIFHVEDDAGDRDLFQMAASRSGVAIDVAVACDGQEAIRLLTSRPPTELPQLILLDLNLPKMDGRDFLVELKRNERLKVIPVVVLTTSNAPVGVAHCYRHGVAGYLVKPIDFTELTSLVKRLLEFWQWAEFVSDSFGPE